MWRRRCRAVLGFQGWAPALPWRPRTESGSMKALLRRSLRPRRCGDAAAMPTGSHDPDVLAQILRATWVQAQQNGGVLVTTGANRDYQLAVDGFIAACTASEHPRCITLLRPTKCNKWRWAASAVTLTAKAVRAQSFYLCRLLVRC